ncbi:hypothetical protein K8B33_05375 [Alcanivorax sp. JB21]|uniref:hypothetical protein n=1 Tax=Alcanivorax limicola TaxID=2874102 RepID=UPI001CBE95E0|nr:hypothetical protein [Alcanivorax limicola]MBZ2188515.1 hypothetical protein [Alcanivorax limicola]
MNHGPLLTRQEYERHIVALYHDVPPSPPPDRQRALARQELDLLIDHRLGIHFPNERRDALWQVHQRYQGSLLRSMAFAISHRLMNLRLNWLSRRFLRAYRALLSEEEFHALFGNI